jgi:hypothetical protein
MKIINNIMGALLVMLVLFCTVLSSCAKKPTPAPTPTPTPVTTYTFSAFGVTATGVQYNISNNTTAGVLQINASNATASANSNEQTVTITINSAVNSVGIYTLSSSTNNTGVYTSGSNTFKYSTNSSPYVGTLNITNIDMTNKIMSATYNFNPQQYYPSVGGSGNVSGSFTNIGFQ